MRSVCFWLACLVLLGVLFGCGSGRGRVREAAPLQSPSAETEVVRFGSAEQLSGDLEILGILVEDAAHDWPAEEAARAAALLSPAPETDGPETADAPPETEEDAPAADAGEEERSE